MKAEPLHGPDRGPVQYWNQGWALDFRCGTGVARNFEVGLQTFLQVSQCF